MYGSLFVISVLGPFKCYVKQMGVGRGQICQRYLPLRGWERVNFPGKKCYVTLEWAQGLKAKDQVVLMGQLCMYYSALFCTPLYTCQLWSSCPQFTFCMLRTTMRLE